MPNTAFYNAVPPTNINFAILKDNIISYSNNFGVGSGSNLKLGMFRNAAGTWGVYNGNFYHYQQGGDAEKGSAGYNNTITMYWYPNSWLAYPQYPGDPNYDHLKFTWNYGNTHHGVILSGSNTTPSTLIPKTNVPHTGPDGNGYIVATMSNVGIKMGDFRNSYKGRYPLNFRPWSLSLKPPAQPYFSPTWGPTVANTGTNNDLCKWVLPVETSQYVSPQYYYSFRVMYSANADVYTGGGDYNSVYVLESYAANAAPYENSCSRVLDAAWTGERFIYSMAAQSANATVQSNTWYWVSNNTPTANSGWTKVRGTLAANSTSAKSLGGTGYVVKGLNGHLVSLRKWIYSSGWHGIEYSTDHGLTWTQTVHAANITYNDIGKPFYAAGNLNVWIIPTYSSTWTPYTRLIKSSNSNPSSIPATTTTTVTMPAGTNAHALMSMAFGGTQTDANGFLLAISLYSNAVFKSVDGGSNWTVVNNTETFAGVYAGSGHLEYIENGTWVYSGTNSSNGGCVMYTSENDGVNWNTVFSFNTDQPSGYFSPKPFSGNKYWGVLQSKNGNFAAANAMGQIWSSPGFGSFNGY